MKIFQWLLLKMVLINASVSYGQDVLKDHNQLLVVIGQDWDAVQAQMQRYERDLGNEPWGIQKVGDWTYSELLSSKAWCSKS